MKVKNKSAIAVVAAALSFSLAMAIGTPSAHALEREGHGGSPEEIEAEPFSNPSALKGALALIAERVAKSNLPSEFKSKLIDEVESLHRDGKFYSLPAIIVQKVSRNSGDSSGASQSQDRFVDLGGFTDPWPGASVYFSSRVSKYGPDKLAPVVLHEVLHHLVSRALSEDESFIDDLNKAILNGELSPALQFALQKGVYLRAERIDRDQFLEFLGLQQIAENYFSRVKDPFKLKGNLNTRLYRNLADMPVATFIYHLEDAASDGKKNAEYLFLQIAKLVVDSARAMNPNNPWLSRLSERFYYPDQVWFWACKKTSGGYFTSRCKEDILMKDLFTLPMELNEPKAQEHQ